MGDSEAGCHHAARSLEPATHLLVQKCETVILRALWGGLHGAPLRPLGGLGNAPG